PSQVARCSDEATLVGSPIACWGCVGPQAVQREGLRAGGLAGRPPAQSPVLVSQQVFVAGIVWQLSIVTWFLPPSTVERSPVSVVLLVSPPVIDDSSPIALFPSPPRIAWLLGSHPDVGTVPAPVRLLQWPVIEVSMS